jgi:hypothetical protein
MHVGVDEAGHQGCVAEVDDLRSGWVSDVGSYGGDALAFDQDFGRSDDLSVRDVEHPCGVEDDGMLQWRGLGATNCSKADGEAAEKDFHRSSSIPRRRNQKPMESSADGP